MKQIYIRKCDDYQYINVKKSFQNIINDIGGLEKYLKRGSRVLVKPNLLMKKRPQEATTTHPMLIKVLCEELLKLNCKIIIADSPGGPYTVSSLNGIYKTCGLEKVAKELNIELNYDTSSIKVDNKDGHILRNMDIIKPIKNVDYIINVCKLKTHMLTKYTGATKNLYGCIAGLKKAEIHYRFPTEELFAENVLLDICNYIKPTLTIMDAIVGMEGNGPSAGKPRKIGAILLSENPYALDVAACKIINLNPYKVPTIRGAIKRNYINPNFLDIKIIGENIENIIVKDYKIPKVKNEVKLFPGKLPNFLNEAISRLITPKPIVRVKDCIKCGKCKEACPAQVIEIKEQGAIINLNKCIKCYCCHELCPKQAIDIKRKLF